MRITPGLVILLLILGFIFFNVGFNIFGFIMALIPTLLYIGGIAGLQDAKATMYLANKYDEEKNSKK